MLTLIVERAPLDRAEFERWRRSADGALASARREAAAGAHNWACFMAEQSAQLGSKALLHGIGKGPWGHDLVALAELIRAAGLEVPGDIGDALRRLGRHYTATRYPDAHPAGDVERHFGESDSSDAIRDAVAVLSYVDRTWGSG